MPIRSYRHADASIAAALASDEEIRDRLASCARSAHAQGCYLMLVGGLIFVKPHMALGYFHRLGMLAPIGSETNIFFFRLFGAFGMCNTGFFYSVAAHNRYAAFFKVSVLTRCVILPLVHVALVYFEGGATGAAWLAAAIPIDFLLGLHMLWNLTCKRGQPRRLK